MSDYEDDYDYDDYGDYDYDYGHDDGHDDGVGYDQYEESDGGGEQPPSESDNENDELNSDEEEVVLGGSGEESNGEIGEPGSDEEGNFNDSSEGSESSQGYYDEFDWGDSNGPISLAGAANPALTNVPSAVSTGSNEIPFETEVHSLLQRILASSESRKRMTRSKGAKAQTLLDILQKVGSHVNVELYMSQCNLTRDSDYQVLDSESASPALRPRLLKAALRLCKSSRRRPSCPELPQIEDRSDPIQTGSFGEVVRGRCNGYLVCLKVVKVYQDRDINHLIRLFTREALLWSQLDHPNVLPFYGIYPMKHDPLGRVCLVSPWMSNGNVMEYLRDNPEAPRLYLVQAALEGIKYLHEKETVHGDIKGANILVLPNSSACIADFGLSTVVDESIIRWTSTLTRKNGGTLRWEAPELLDDLPDGDPPKPTFKSDIYSIGSTMYEILTGRIPYHEFLREPIVLRKIVGGVSPTKPSIAEMEALELTEEVWNLIEECWAIDPADRPTIEIVLQRLKAIPLNSVATRHLARQGQEQERQPDHGTAQVPSSRSFRSSIRGHKEIFFSEVEVNVLRDCVQLDNELTGTSVVQQVPEASSTTVAPAHL
ncbi:hypothetical protein NP233_g3214 [Leucocoprinus birnbaumii]|uniref:Protein kinase domain-containing protein n=1 Tax=Leucocoprinus birnbaumii TaxID=56174 RepID=A0AAD5VZI1_9AGAR|nr:hypothetical protein NP233_g3214 [Leucocoprinus birnbaumii]